MSRFKGKILRANSVTHDYVLKIDFNQEDKADVLAVCKAMGIEITDKSHYGG